MHVNLNTIYLQNDVDLLYTKRRDHIRYVCDNIEETSMRKPVAVLASQLWHIPSLNIIYCPLNENDEPSWTHNLNIWLADESNLRSHSNTEFKDIKRVHGKSLWHTEDELQTALKTSLKVIFTQNPYWQLFRFYVNNFLSPSKHYLDVGKDIISKFKKEPSLKNKKCGHNITFQEFSRFVKSTPYKKKWAGVTQKCDLCSVNYDILGKEESFLQDMAHVYRLSRPDTPIPHVSDIQARYDKDEIESFVRSAFTRKDEIDCLSDHSILIRLWRQLQIWGFISIGNNYPYSAKKSKTIEYPVMLNTVLTAYGESRNITSSNKIDAFTLAFHQLTFNDVNEVRQFYRKDFTFMSENDHPARVFFKQGPKPEFEYFDVISSD